MINAIKNVFGKKEKELQIPNTPKIKKLPELPELPEAQAIASESKDKMAGLVSMDSSNIPPMNIDQIPGYKEWLKDRAEYEVVRLLGNMEGNEKNGTLFIYSGGICYLYPTGRWLMPTALFTNKFDFIDPSVPGFVFDTSMCKDPAEARLRILDHIILTTTREPLRLKNITLEKQEIIDNPLNY